MIKIITASLVIFTFQTAIAQSLAEKKLYSQEESAIVSQVAHVNKQCQTDIKVSFDWTGFTKEGLNERGAASFCNEALAAVVRVCEDNEESLKAIQQGIKEVVCSRATPRSIGLSNGILSFGMDYDAANDSNAVYEYLINNL